MSRVIVEIVPGGRMPAKAHSDDAAYDCFARSVKQTDIHLTAHLGFRIEIPPGYFGDLRPRSSVYKHGLVMANSCGIIDAGFRGEVAARFYRLPWAPAISYLPSDRVAQLIIRKLDYVALVPGEVNINSDRGTGGFGSTGNR